jgi:hypothetical protein
VIDFSGGQVSRKAVAPRGRKEYNLLTPCISLPTRRAKCPAHLFLRDFVTLIVFVEN